jgi:hypothetical protein
MKGAAFFAHRADGPHPFRIHDLFADPGLLLL